MFTIDGRGVAHFLVQDGPAAMDALQQAGMTVTGCTRAVTTRLAQGVPGQLGAFCRAMADAGVNIQVLYSDHDGNLILLVDDTTTGRQIAAAWPVEVEVDVAVD